MTDTAIDWLSYICKSGYFAAQFDAATAEPVTDAIVELDAEDPTDEEWYTYMPNSAELVPC